MTQSLTDRLQTSRLVVVSTDPVSGTVRVRGADDVCSTVSCHGETLVVTDEGTGRDLAGLQPGDIVKIESQANRAERIVVLRRAWEEWASPEV